MRNLGRYFLVAVFVRLIRCTTISKGEDYLANDFTTHQLAITALSSSKAIYCVRDTTTNNFMRCKTFTIFDQQIYADEGLLIETPTDIMSLARFSNQESLLCYQNVTNFMYGVCTALELSDPVLKKGSDYVMNDGDTQEISTAAPKDTIGIMCYKGGDGLTCKSMFRECQGSSCLRLAKGEPLHMNLERPIEVTVATVSATTVCVCWRGFSSESYGKCTMLKIDGSAMGKEVKVTDGELQEQVWHASVVALSEKTIIVCYQDIVLSDSFNSESGSPVGRCNTFRTRGMLLEMGPKLNIAENGKGAEDISLARLSNVLAVVCYIGGQISRYATCHSLNLFGDDLTKGDDLVLNTQDVSMTSVVALSDTEALACYRDADTTKGGVTPGRGMCNVLQAEVIQLRAVTDPPSWSATTTLKAVLGMTGGAKRRSQPCNLALVPFWISVFLLHVMH